MDLGPRHTSLGENERQHLRQLVASWNMLADLSFSDLLLLAPAATVQVSRDHAERYVVLAQVRPTTSQTLYVDDQVGRFVPAGQRPLVGQALREGVTVQDEVTTPGSGLRAIAQAIPVRCGNKVIAVISSERPVLEHRDTGDLENHYQSVYRCLLSMITEGSFPYRHEPLGVENQPRVGDGALVVDQSGQLVYSSPNAVSALHRVGFHGNAKGRRLEDIGVARDAIRTSLRLKVPFDCELERGNVTIYMRVFPLLGGSEVVGMFALMRDVSDLRSRERLLVSMDATIREIHHRVKNNLQTVSSLLRLQSRRVKASESREALEEAIRRVRSIALVHEMLAQGGGDQVNFGDVLRPIVKLAEEALVTPDRPISFEMFGEGPVLATSTASSLAVMLNELLQNAVEHGYPPGSAGGSVAVYLHTDGTELAITVRDYGVGVSKDFDAATSDGLGLTIIRTLMTGELGGAIAVTPATGGGTEAVLRVQL